MLEKHDSQPRHFRRVGEEKTVQRAKTEREVPLAGTLRLIEWATYGTRDFPAIAYAARQELNRLSFRAHLGVEKGMVIPFCRADAAHAAVFLEEEL